MLIGLGHKARVGKDTVAAYLVREHGFIRVAFADRLKAAARAMFDLTAEQTSGNLKETVDEFWRTTPRDLLQRLGTEAGRDVFGPEVWVKGLERTLMGLRASTEGIVITDMRFTNEAAAVDRWGGYAVKVLRPQAGPIGTSTHSSETALDSYPQWDWVLDNSGTLSDLYRNIEEMLKVLGSLRC